MKNQMLQNVFDISKLYLKNHSATVLTIAGAVGVVATSVMTARATIKAIEDINEAECEKKEELTKMEIVKVTGLHYIPPILVGASTIACIFGANILNKQQQAALMSAYALVDNSFKEYKEKLKELYGEEAHNNIINSLMVEKAKKVDVYSYDFMSANILTLEDETCDICLFYDVWGERYFESTIERVMNAEYHLNRNFTMRGYATLNEFYEFLGIEDTLSGSMMGWAIDDDITWIDFNHRKTELDDGFECYIVETSFDPSADWREYSYF